MEDFMGLAVGLGTFLVLICLGLFVGGALERRHFQNLQLRERQTDHVLVTQLRTFPQARITELAPTMLVAETVISSDYLKSFLAGLKNIVGGELRSFETLLERARREALLRLKEESIRLGYDAICNVRFETADIGGRGSNNKNKIVMASILATCTAYTSSRQR